MNGLTLIRKIKTSWTDAIVMFPPSEDLRQVAENLFASNVGRTLQFVELQYLTADGARWQLFEHTGEEMLVGAPMASTNRNEWKE